MIHILFTKKLDFYKAENEKGNAGNFSILPLKKGV